MSSSPAQSQLSPSRSPPLSPVLPRSPPCDTPTTPSTCLPHAPPTPPDSLSRAAQNTASPPSTASTDLSSDLSLSAALSSPQFQSRLLDTPIDIHCLSPELESPAVPQESPAPVERDGPTTFKAREQSSPTPTQEATMHKDSLPAPFVPASVRLQREREEPAGDPSLPPHPDSRPPNVYINGLPPNFPEEDLLAMTRPFGTVLSVRTFTRHVSDKPSGYGFVLFETYSAAEKCIESLRKYRNLHPSFSKQMHKIPGTLYASVPSSLNTNTGPADSFKCKMEQLGDTSSTNLYMEGLPMSITDDTLRALVTPYRIMSYRFFQTRLSRPPRIIAFVRLESRDAAEDIVERLHGRLVRGWNDAGCRISVRFADTADQRELRRTERHSREGDQSPARLTMARAALLNLKGTQCQTTAHSPLLTDMDMGPTGATSPSLGYTLNQLALGQLGGQISPLGGTPPLPSKDAFGRGTIGRQDLSALGVPGLDALNARAAHATAQNLRLPQQMASTDLLDEQTELQLALLGMQGLRTRAQNGYTPVEQLILQAHTRQQQRAGVVDSVHAQHSRGVAAVGPRLNSAMSTGREVNRLLDLLPQMSEDDFHASGGLQQYMAQDLSPELSAEAFSRIDVDSQASLAVDLARQLSLSNQQTRQRNHTLAAQARSDLDSQASHIRSTTLPSQYLSVHNSSYVSNLNSPLYDSNVSLGSNVSSNSVRSSKMSNLHVTNSKRNHYAPSSNSTTSRNTSTSNPSSNALPDTQTLFSSKHNINVPSSASRVGVTSTAAAPAFIDTSNRLSNAQTTVNRPAGTSVTHRAHDADDEDSPVVSPALTYSVRTPASLSPATPYSGFFDGGDTFKNAGINISHGGMAVIGDMSIDSGIPSGKKPADPM